MPRARPRTLPYALPCAVALLLIAACDERPQSAPPARSTAPSAPPPKAPPRPAPPRPAPLPADGVMLTLPAPPGLGAETRALCVRLDGSLKQFGKTIQRVGRHLGYERRCEGAPARFAKLQREQLTALAKPRAALRKLPAKLAKLPPAERPAFWRWLRKLRRWLEDELVTHVVDAERAAQRFAARCPRAADTIAKTSKPLDQLRVEALVLHRRLFVGGGAPKPEKPDAGPGWRAIRSLVDTASHRPRVPIPKRLSAEVRRRCRRFALTAAASIALVRAYGQAFRGKPSCAEVARRVSDRDGMKAMWREVTRELGRSYAALKTLTLKTLTEADERRRADRWARRLMRKLGKTIARRARHYRKELRRLLRRCPRRTMRPLYATHRGWERPMLAGYLYRGLTAERRLPRRLRAVRRQLRRLMRRHR